MSCHIKLYLDLWCKADQFFHGLYPFMTPLAFFTNITQQNISYIKGLEQRVVNLEKQLNGYLVKEAGKSEEIRSAPNQD